MKSPIEEIDREAFVRSYRAVMRVLESTTTESARAAYEAVANAMRERWRDLTGGKQRNLHEDASVTTREGNRRPVLSA